MFTYIYNFFNPSNLYQGYSAYLWLIVTVLFLLFELSAPGLFFFVSLACGSAIAAISAWFGCSWITQCIIALSTTLVSFFIFDRTIANKKMPLAKTNTNALIGHDAIIITTIELRGIGRVKVRGEEWPAIAQDQGVILEKGTIVKVLYVEGNKLVVS